MGLAALFVASRAGHGIGEYAGVARCAQAEMDVRIIGCPA
jgi:hypothetical protein